MKKLLKTNEIASQLGIQLHHSTVIRWTRKGVVVDGKKVILPSVRIGNRIYVSEEELQNFVAKLNCQVSEFQNPGMSMFSPPVAEKPPAEVSRCLDDMGV